MPRGGYRDNSGRNRNWVGAERTERAILPVEIKNNLVPILMDLWNKKEYRSQDFVQAINRSESGKIKMYDSAASAGAHSTSSVGIGSTASYQEIDLYDLLIDNDAETFIIPVSGDSMIGIGIYPGDLLIVDSRNKNPQVGDIVVVVVNDEVMVKRFHREEEAIILLSENPEHPPISLDEGSSISINGIVKNSIRRNLSKS